jgi:thiol:disulfide interchange protein
MSGAIELGSRLMNLGSNLADCGGEAGSFFTGVLAVVVASPCTAPFMGTALGYALVQPRWQALPYSRPSARGWPPPCCCCPTASLPGA